MKTIRANLRVICAVLTMLVVMSNLLPAFDNPEAGNASQNSGTSNAGPSARAPEYPLAAAYPEPLGDYVPCMFDRRQLFALRSLVPPKDGTEAAIAEAFRFDPQKALAFVQEMASNPAGSHEPAVVYSNSYANAMNSGFPELQAQSIGDKGKQGAEAGQFKRPLDIGCAMTIYSWKEASDNFGRRVADNFIAIQVTVRNLNPSLEFLLHDAELAADANMSGLSRFQSSHERRVVRNVGQVGQITDPRNVAVRIMEGIGMVAGAATGFAPSGYALGYSVYTAGAIPAFKHVMPDMTQDQLNNISDLAFTSFSGSRIVVPKSGAVTFVTFILSAPLEQACWLQPNYDVRQDVSYGAPLNACPEPSGSEAGSTNRKNGGKSDAWKTISYKNWNAIQQQAFIKHAYAVIAGVHIQEVHKGAVTKLDCPVLKDGTADLSKTQNGTYSCAVTGTDLDSVGSVTLTQATSTITGKWVPAKDQNPPQAQFAVSDLDGLSGDYNFNLIYPSGESADSGQTLKFAVRTPKVSDAGFDTTDLSKAKNNTITMTIQGSDLDRIGSVKLSSSGGADYPGTLGTGITSSDTSGTVTFNAALLAGAVNQPLSMSYTTKDKPNTNLPASSKSLPVTFTNSAKAADAMQGGAPAKVKAKNKPGVSR